MSIVFPILIQILMAVSAMALLAFNAQLFGFVLSKQILFAAFCGVFGFYLLDSVADKNPEDRINKYLRWGFFYRYGSALYAFGVGLITVAGLALLREIVSWHQVLFLCALSVVAWLYSSFGPNKVRRVPYLKTFWVAMTWTAAAIFIPLQFGRISTEPRVGLGVLTVCNFYWLFIDTFVLDWKDALGDRQYGIKTLPQRLSQRSALAVMLLLGVGMTLASFLFYRVLNPWFGVWPVQIFWVSFIQTVTLFAALVAGSYSQTVFEVLVMVWRLAMIVMVSL